MRQGVAVGLCMCDTLKETHNKVDEYWLGVCAKEGS